MNRISVVKNTLKSFFFSSIFFVSSCGLPSHAQFKPGCWKSNTVKKVSFVESGGEINETRKNSEHEFQMEPGTSLDSFLIPNYEKSSECIAKDYSRKGNTSSWTQYCTENNGEAISIEFKVEASLEETSITTKSTFSLSDSPVDIITNTTNIQARHVGRCDS